MAKNKRLSLLQQQKAKLKKQRALAKTPKAKAIVDRRIQRVIVQIENTQKQLKGAPANKALPPGKTTPTGRPSAKRAIKAAQLERAAQGTTGGTRTGQPAGRANRVHGANVTARATRRAVRETALRNAGRTGLKILGKAGQLLSGDGSGQLAMGAVTASNLIDAARGSTAKERNAKKKGQSGLSKNQQETLRKQADANRSRKNEKARVSKLGNPTAKTRATYNKPTSTPKTKDSPTPKTKDSPTPKTKDSPTPKAKPDNRSTLSKEIDGLTKFIATHKGKKGMESALDQAAKRLAEKKKKRGNRSSLMSGNVKSNRTTG